MIYVDDENDEDTSVSQWINNIPFVSPPPAYSPQDVPWISTLYNNQ